MCLLNRWCRSCCKNCMRGTLSFWGFNPQVFRKLCWKRIQRSIRWFFWSKQMCSDCLIWASWQPLSQLLYYSKSWKRLVHKLFIGAFSPFDVEDQSTYNDGNNWMHHVQFSLIFHKTKISKWHLMDKSFIYIMKTKLFIIWSDIQKYYGTNNWSIVLCNWVSWNALC